MQLRIVVVSLCFLYLFAGVVQSQTSYPIDYTNVVTTSPYPTPKQAYAYYDNTDIQTCACDLTEGECDPNCCCDPLCPLGATRDALFTTCAPASVATYNSQLVCSNLATVNVNLTSVTVAAFVGSSLCVYRVNSPYTGRYFTTPTEITDQAVMTTYVIADLYTPEMSRSAYTAPTTYKVGTALVATSNNGAKGRFSVPMEGMSGQCEDASFARYMKGTARRGCQRTVTSLSASCATVFATSTYLTDYTVLATPTGVATPAVNITVVYKRDSTTGVLTNTGTTTIPAPTYAASVCSNALYEIAFTAVDDGIGGVVGLRATVILQDITEKTDLSGVGRQYFSFEWEQSGATYAVPRSGNPGYLTGYPVPAGRIASNGAVVAIERDVAYEGGLTRTGVSPSGACSTSIRAPILFGEDFTGGCAMPVTSADVDGGCVTLRTTTLNMLRGTYNFTRVARWGNSSVLNPFEWLTLTDNIPTLSASVSVDGQCAAVPTAIRYEFLTAKVGALSNPQTALVAARISYSTGTVGFSCFAGRCTTTTAGATTPLFLQTTVVFIDTTNGVLTEGIIPPPSVFPALPADIFYPFYLNPASSLSPSSVLLLASLLLSCVLAVFGGL